jgi:hypothetical protein
MQYTFMNSYLNECIKSATFELLMSSDVDSPSFLKVAFLAADLNQSYSDCYTCHHNI